MAWVFMNKIVPKVRRVLSRLAPGQFTETILLGNMAVQLPGQKLLWDSENMQVTNIGSDEKIRTTKLSPFSEDIVTREVERASKDWVEQNALEMCEEWIKHEYQNDWKL